MVEEQIVKQAVKKRSLNSVLWNVYMIITILILIIFVIFSVKNFNYIKYSPCEACIKMGYSCSGLTNIDKNAQQAWQEVIAEKAKEIEEFKKT